MKHQQYTQFCIHPPHILACIGANGRDTELTVAGTGTESFLWVRTGLQGVLRLMMLVSMPL